MPINPAVATSKPKQLCVVGCMFLLGGLEQVVEDVLATTVCRSVYLEPTLFL